MESPTTSTCEPYRQSGQKRCRKFYARKPAKKERRTRVHAKTAEVGCVLGAGEDGNGWGRVKPDEKTRCPNQNAPDDLATRAKRKPAKTQCFRRFCGRGRRTCLACWLGQLAAERHWRSLTPRHAVLEWMWESAPGSGKRPMSSGSHRKSQRGRCWFGAVSSFWRRIVYRLPLLPSKEKHLRQEDGQADQDHGRVGPGGI